MTWEEALWKKSTKGCFTMKNGKYAAKVCDDGRYHYLGVFEDIEEAKAMVFRCRMNRLISALNYYGLDIEDAVVYEEKYLVFDGGMIFNLNGKSVEGHKDGEGRIRVKLNGKFVMLHRVVAECFIPNPKYYLEVRHLNNVKNDNRIENLEWCEKKETMKHVLINKGEKHPNSKLTEGDVRYIRKSKQKDQTLAKKFGVSQSVISDVKNKKTWKYVQ